jgi:hypothetical protein
MVTTSPGGCVLAIGEVAGTVWKMLAENGPLTMAKLVKRVGEPRDLVMQAIGWLAREGKISIDDSGRNRLIGLEPSPH